MQAVIKITEDEEGDRDIPEMFEVYLFTDERDARIWHEAQPQVEHISYYHTTPFTVSESFEEKKVEVVIDRRPKLEVDRRMDRIEAAIRLLAKAEGVEEQVDNLLRG